MKFFSLFKSFLASVVHAVGQFFEWLNRREDQQQRNETNDRVSDIMSAAAKPTRENADRINRWLSRGRTGRLRERREDD